MREDENRLVVYTYRCSHAQDDHVMAYPRSAPFYPLRSIALPYNLYSVSPTIMSFFPHMTDMTRMRLFYCSRSQVSLISIDNKNVYTYLQLVKLGINAAPLCVFKQVLCDDFFEMIVTEMNRYAAQIKMEQNTKMNQEWYPLTNDEVKAYFALYIIMSPITKSKIDMYWSK
ncbi:hypothetical protein M0804_003517 [Polistes exclamans]|nr:hypothetical protein M0804_003517 [Polistes exclamans]